MDRWPESKPTRKDFFGMIEWKAVREVASQFLLPKHTAAAAWKHRNLFYVEQEGLLPMPKDRGAEQGDVDGPLECSLTLGWWRPKRGCAQTRSRRQTPFHGLAWTIHQNYSNCKADHATRLQESANFWLGGPDLGARLSLQEFDVVNAKVGAELEPPENKSHLRTCGTAGMQRLTSCGGSAILQNMAKVSICTAGSITALGLTTRDTHNSWKA